MQALTQWIANQETNPPCSWILKNQAILEHAVSKAYNVMHAVSKAYI